MSKKRRTNLPKRHSQRVAAWIYGVINSILESLQREMDLLDRGNLTWRSDTGRCDVIRAIQEYVESSQWPNYFDFLADNPQFLPSFESHDESLGKLNAKARELYAWLLRWEQLSVTVEALLDTYEGERASDPQATSLTYMRADLPKEVAANLINNVQALPSHFVISKFWAKAAKNLLQFRNLPEFRPLHIAKEELKGNSLSLKGTLEGHRLALSRKFDVPAAPILDYLAKR